MEQGTFLFALQPGERLLWSGQPKRGILFRSSDLFLIPFSLLWCGFAVFWEASVIRMDGPFIMKLWGIPFVCVGAYLVVGRFFAEAFIRSRTHYALTNERALIHRGGFRTTNTSVDLFTTPEINLQVKKDGTGRVVFGRAGAFDQLFNSQRNAAPAAFDLIPDAQAVYDIVVRAKREGRGS